MLLYAAPGTCARVPTIALEEAGAPFTLQIVRFLKHEQKSAAFRNINPKGRVPAIVIDGEVLTENLAILLLLNARFPLARLLPATDSDVARLRQIADLSFCASTLHPIVARIRVPQFIGSKESAADVFKSGCAAMTEYAGLVEERLKSQPWWYGEQWSVVDAYLYWVFWRVSGAGFDLANYPNIVGHVLRMEDRPAVRRALQREDNMQKTLEAEGLARSFDNLQLNVAPNVTTN